MNANKCLTCGQKPKFETAKDESGMHRISCRCGSGPWHPASDDVTPMLSEWNTKNTPAPEEFKHPEPEHQIAETQPFVSHVPIINS